MNIQGMFNIGLNLYKYAPDTLLLEFMDIAGDNLAGNIMRTDLEINRKCQEIIETVPAATTIMVVYDIRKTTFTKIAEKLLEIINGIDFLEKTEPDFWQIPICYESPFASDLKIVCQKNDIPERLIIEMHAATEYWVSMIGFLPGFVYLGGLKSELHLPRKEKPALKVEAGSVGIAGNYTGIYPKDTPGGWHIIGNSPVSLFDVKSTPPMKIKQGDWVKFSPISMKEFIEMKTKPIIWKKRRNCWSLEMKK